MKKVYALGLHKTGSTTLQRFLLHNQLTLLRHGILYPPVEAQGVARLLGEASGRTKIGRNPRLNEYMAHNALALRIVADAVEGTRFPEGHQPMLPADLSLHMIEEIAGVTNAEALILSSEEFAKATLTYRETPVRLSRQFGAKDTTLLVAVRRPDEAITAWQSQRLKFPNPVPSLWDTGITGYLKTVHFDFKNALEPWFEHFADAKIRITPYEEQKRRGGSVELFQAQCGLNLPDDMAEVPDSNPGLHPGLYEIARIGTHRLERRGKIALRNYLTKASRRIGLPKPADIEMLGKGMRAKLAQEFAPIHDWLGEVSGRRPFFEDIDDIAAPRPLDNREVAKSVLADVLADAQGRLEDGDALAFLRDLNRRGFDA